MNTSFGIQCVNYFYSKIFLFLCEDITVEEEKTVLSQFEFLSFLKIMVLSQYEYLNFFTIGVVKFGHIFCLSFVPI